MVYTFPTQIAKTYEDKHLIILTLQCSTENELLDSQIDLARDMAKNILQQTGATVSATSTALWYRTHGDGIVWLTAEVEDAEDDAQDADTELDEADVET